MEPLPETNRGGKGSLYFIFFIQLGLKHLLNVIMSHVIKLGDITVKAEIPTCSDSDSEDLHKEQCGHSFPTNIKKIAYPKIKILLSFTPIFFLYTFYILYILILLLHMISMSILQNLH